jgi:hypothetical protein
MFARMAYIDSRQACAVRLASRLKRQLAKIHAAKEEEQVMFAKTTVAMLALATVMLIEPHSANAAPYWPWCSQSDQSPFAHACAFSSWEQCMQTVRGIGGYCYVNPYGPAPAVIERPAKRHRHAARN